MTALLDFLAELRRCGVELSPNGDRLRYRAPHSVLTDEVRAELVAHKSEILELLQGEPERKTSETRETPDSAPCYACGSRSWWERPAEDGGGLACGRCHPDPRPDLLAWEPRTDAATTISLDSNRQRLFDWALANGCPALRFRPWASVVGTPSGWLAFLQTASDDDVHAALEAADQHAA